MKPSPGRLRAIESPKEAFEATGFVMDCILGHGSIDGHLGDTASLRPVELVRDESGAIKVVICTVRPCGVDKDLRGLLCSRDHDHQPERILFPVPA